MDDAKYRQRDEVSALIAILGDESTSAVFTDDLGRSCGQLIVAPIIPDDFTLKVVETGTGNRGEAQWVSEEHRVDFLPPFTLEYALPPDYPSRNPPEFTLHSEWATPAQLAQLCSKLDSLWLQSQFSEILFVWFEFLRTDSLIELGIRDCVTFGSDDSVTCGDAPPVNENSTADDRRVRRDVATNSEAVDAVLEYNAVESRRRFERTLFSCGICLQERAGKFGMQYGTCRSHTFCRECATRHFTFCIASGSVRDLTCPADSCSAVVHPAQVKELVPEQYEKYERLLLQTTLDSMPDIIYCPLPHCQSAVICEGESKMASCPSCRYVFCRLCKRAFHGLSLCRISSEAAAEIGRLYLLDDRAALAKLEQQYGKHAVQRVVLRARREQEETKKTRSSKVLSIEWISVNCKKCPQCEVNIEKATGCNKMRCMKCGIQFCWRCERKLNSFDSYDHFTVSHGCQLYH